MSQADANLAIKSGAALIKDGLDFYEGPDSPLNPDQLAEAHHIHRELLRLVRDAESLAGVGTGGFHTDDGTPKPG